MPQLTLFPSPLKQRYYKALNQGYTKTFGTFVLETLKAEIQARKDQPEPSRRVFIKDLLK